jgi:hypothetical protein
MRSAALGPRELTKMTADGIAEMRGLLTPAECEALAPPLDIVWNTEEPDSPSRSWSHSPEYRFGPQASAVNPNLQAFLGDFRRLVQLNAVEADIPELMRWGKTPFNNLPVELLGLRRSVYGARWHRTAASHEIGWHTDDTHDQADKDIEGEFGVRALGLMVAVSLTEHGGTYEYAPASTRTNPEGMPCDPSAIQRIEDVRQGDAVGFCTAVNSLGELWPGSFPWHRFIADKPSVYTSADVSRDSLVIFLRDVSERTFGDVGLAGLIRGVKGRLLRQ